MIIMRYLGFFLVNMTQRFDQQQDKRKTSLQLIVVLIVVVISTVTSPSQTLAQADVDSCPRTAGLEAERCDPWDSEGHPLRPYPCEICGPEADREIEDTNEPYCAMRPWAAKNVGYLRHTQGCELNDPNFPCVAAVQPQDNPCGIDANPNNLPCIAGTYTVDARAYELPLVSVNRAGYDYLTFFNRAQEHLADYLEGRAFYEGVLEPDINSLVYIDQRPELWNRAGVYRKLLSALPFNEDLSTQRGRKISMIDNAGDEHHDYIVGFEDNGEPANWNQGNPVRLSDFSSHLPPEYTCSAIASSVARNSCIATYIADRTQWADTIYGKLWSNIPTVTREDAIGFIQVNPEPGQPFSTIEERVSIPHLPRLNQVSTYLQDMLASNLLPVPVPPEEETEADMGEMCPAGPWAMSGAACLAGGGSAGCDPTTVVDCHNVSNTHSCVRSQSDIENLALAWVSGRPGNNVAACYGDVIAHASGNIHPALSMLIWLNESNASNYSISRQDFGVNNPALECSFERQNNGGGTGLSGHIQLPSVYRSNYSSCFSNPPLTTLYPNLSTASCGTGPARPMNDLEVFLAIYRSGSCDSSTGRQYACNIQSRWRWVSTCALIDRPEG